MSVFGELVMANIKETLRDRMATFWFLAFPILFILLFGAIFSNGGQSTINIGTVDESRGGVSQQITKVLSSVKSFKVHKGDKASEIKALKNGDRSLVILIPKNTNAFLAQGKTVQLPVYYDASKQTTGQLVLPAISEVINEIDRGLTRSPRLVLPVPKAVQAKKLKDIDYLLPGILAMALMQLGLFGALRIVGLRERKVLKGIGVTPLPRYLFVASEILVRLLMALVQASAIIIIGHLVYGVTVVGNWFAVFGIVLLGAAMFVSLGYLLVCFSKTVESGQGIIQLVQFPMMFLSGIFFPMDLLPKFLAPIVKALPLTYLGEALRQIMVGATSAYSLSTNLLVLAGWLVVTMALSIRLWRWE